MKPDNLNHDPLTSLLGRVPLEQPSGGFTDAVMGKISLLSSIEQIKRSVWERIPVYVWILGAAIISLVCLYLSGMIITFLLSPQNHFLANTVVILEALVTYVINIFKESKFTSLVTSIVVSVVSLLVIDQGVRNRKVAHS